MVSFALGTKSYAKYSQFRAKNVLHLSETQSLRYTTTACDKERWLYEKVQLLLQVWKVYYKMYFLQFLFQ